MYIENIKNLDRQIATTLAIEAELEKAKNEEDVISYWYWADQYRQLAEKCEQATLEWRPE